MQADEESTLLLMLECTTHLATTGQSPAMVVESPQNIAMTTSLAAVIAVGNPAMAWLLPRTLAMAAIVPNVAIAATPFQLPYGRVRACLPQ